jgi:hypothetical protein
MVQFDVHLWQRFRAIAAPYWFREEKWPARGLLALLVLLLLGQTGIDVLFNQLTGEFTSALAARDAERFWSAIKKCLAILIVAVPIYAFYYYVRDKLGLHWRRWLTRHLARQLFQQSGVLPTERQCRDRQPGSAHCRRHQDLHPGIAPLSAGDGRRSCCSSSPSAAFSGQFPEKWSLFWSSMRLSAPRSRCWCSARS